MKIGKRKIGNKNSTFIIAEIGQAHDGSLGMAHSFIDAVAGTGADAVKFQTHIAESESTLDEPFRKKFSLQDKTRYDYWKRMEFTPEQWLELKNHAEELGLIFLSSAFSVEAAKLLNKNGIKAWKVGSGEVDINNPLIEYMVKTKLPIILSTGLTKDNELKKILYMFNENSVNYCLLQCTSKYPTPLEEIGLNVVEQYKSKFDCYVGLSDHSGTIWPGLAVVSRNVDVFECHVVFDKRMFGPDTNASITFEELKTIVDFRNNLKIMENNPNNKNLELKKMGKMRNTFGKSIALVSNVKKGTIINKDMLTAKKPGTGIPLSDKNRLIGKKAIKDLFSNRLLAFKDVGE